MSARITEAACDANRAKAESPRKHLKARTGVTRVESDEAAAMIIGVHSCLDCPGVRALNPDGPCSTIPRKVSS